MKQLLVLLMVAALMATQYQSFAQAEKSKMKDGNMKIKTKMGAASTAANMMLPYTANYSSKFRISSNDYSMLILNMWKDYDDNQFDRHADMLADTVRVVLSDGSIINGKENVLNGVKQFRSSLAGAKSRVDAWIPLFSIDRNENWVAIWGAEDDTDQNGKVSSMEMHEIWRINKDGKINLMQQYSRRVPATK